VGAADKELSIGATMTGVARRLTSPTFVGRGTELAVLEVSLERAATNRPSAVFVGGESGVGKTRLLQEFESRARELGACVLHGQCLELGGVHIPYAPLVSALRPEARLILLGDKDQLASVEAGAVLADICPSERANGFSASS